MPSQDRPRALITGGNGNLGQAVAQALRDAGYEVHVTVLDEETRASFAYGLMAEGLAVHPCDQTKEEDVKRVFAEVGSPLHALVATVGGFQAGPFEQVDEAGIDFQYRLNLKSTILTLSHAHAGLAAGHGSAVVIANRPALSCGPGMAVTTAMKAGVISLMKSVAEEWKASGINVNAVAPGIMDTPENRRSMPDADPSLWPTTQQVAAAILFLLSDEGSIVTGTTLPVFGRS